MQLSRASLDVHLGARPGRVESRPILVLAVGVWEHVIVVGGKDGVGLLEGVDVPLRRGHKQLHVDLVVLVNVSDNLLHLLVVLSSILEREIATPRQDEVVGSVHGHDKFMDVVNELDHLLLSVE